MEDEIAKLEQFMEKYNTYISKTIKPQFEACLQKALTLNLIISYNPLNPINPSP